MPLAVQEVGLADDALFRAIVEQQTELISLAQRDGTLRYVNGAYARAFGLAAEEMMGRSLFDFVDAADRAQVRAHWEAVCAQQAPLDGVNRMVSPGGPARWVAWTNRPLRDAQGGFAYMQSVGRDVTAQKAAEQALVDSEQRFRALYEDTPAILHSIDAQGRLLSVSDLWLQTFGYTRDDVIGRPSADFLTAESARHAREVVLPAFFRDGRCDQVDYQFVRRDGTRVDVRLSARLQRDAAGQPLRSLAVMQDVTQARRVAAELTEAHARLDAIVENVPALLGQWDAEGTTRFANREFQAAVGLPPEQIVGHGLSQVLDAIDPTAYEGLAPHVQQVLRGRRQEFELALLTTSGLRQLRLTLVPDRAGGEAVAGFYGMAFDITGHKALELRLTDSEQRYRQLFENLNTGFALHEIVVDRQGRPVDYVFLALNNAFSLMTGLQPAQTLGRRVTELLPGIADDPADWIGVYGSVALQGEPQHFEQYSAALGRWYQIVAYRPAAGQFAVLVQDITARKQAEQALQSALQDKETLLKEVYHRVKNNLQVVQSLLTLQQRSLADGVARSALQDSVQRVRAMALVHEKLYRSGSLAAVSLPEYTQDLLKQIGEATGTAQRGIRLVAQVAELHTGLDNAIPFGLLVAELVGNALKHGFAGRDGGEVCVALAAAGGPVRLTVSDDGAGLPAGLQPQQVASMGLQLAFNLARQLGGELRVDSRQPAVFSAELTRLAAA